ncbi:MAG: zinc metallopeptidase [Lentisphaerae bacterium RIFOXYB12_FULL_65_16]|nr:MAG: zinc metallopeptidase [Lentisphaerae bacterium RIFOXYA12_64_32]OGV92940.1 MAG: zinc metallopeptidase [Lentisphaerae bacterium RIFOXYB12_FULL_65_16]
MLFFDPLYLLFALPGLVLSLWATFYTKSTFGKYSRVRSARGLTGAEAASIMLERSGVRDVRIQRTPGSLTDHYDPTSKTLRLSEDVYDSSSLSAIGVACHEAGHALQHATGYALLGLRTTLVPATNIGSTMSYVFILIGFFLHKPQFILWGAALFSLAVLFSIITLPVEWNASSRAKKAMVECGVVLPQEQGGAASVLNAAFMTYVAAAVTALLTLLYYLVRAGVFGGRRDE